MQGRERERASFLDRTQSRHSDLCRNPLSKVGSHDVSRSGSLGVLWHRNPQGVPQYLAGLKFRLVWGVHETDVDSSPTLLYFWLPRAGGYFQHWQRIVCQGALVHSPVSGTL